MKKVALLSTLSLIGIMTLAGCGGGSGGGNVDKTKAQLTIATFDGGVGDQWLKNAKEIFEAKYQDYDGFEEGKTGVQIHITKVRYAGDYILDTDLLYDMYFTEGVNYSLMAGKGKMLDITDILTEENPEDGGKKIIDKVDENLKSFMNRGDKYYALPFYDCIYGFVYDKDLFKEKSFYMTDDVEVGFTNDEAEFGSGPNGVKGDWDDGLPKTYAQFGKLLERMKLRGVTPFTFSADTNQSAYTARALMSFWADDEGVEQTNLNYTFNGTATNIITGFNDGVPTIESKTISKETGYELRKQAGIYNALKFADDYLTTDPDNYLAASSVYNAQDSFICNKWIPESNKPIGMLVEGTWWQNESINSFKRAQRKYGADSFNYGLMPIPKSDDTKVGQNATFLNLNESYGFIKAGTKHASLAKEFFKFLHTDAQLEAFTLETGMTRGLNYTVSDAVLEQVSTYTRDLVSIKQSEHATMFYPRSSLPFVISNDSVFKPDSWVFSTVNLGQNPILRFIKTNTNAETFFNQHVSALGEDKWQTIVKNF